MRNWATGRECNGAGGVHAVGVLLGEIHSNGNSRYSYKFRSSWVKKKKSGKN